MGDFLTIGGAIMLAPNAAACPKLPYLAASTVCIPCSTSPTIGKSPVKLVVAFGSNVEFSALYL